MTNGKRLTLQQAYRLTPGQRLFYSAGLNEYHIEAYVEVVHSQSDGAKVKITQICSAGKENNWQVGDEISAGPYELEYM